jgi:signal transduction histidine kinase
VESLRRSLRRTERLLACYQLALGHELPNYLVALQGLLYLIREEEHHLSAENQECLQRLGAVLQRTHGMVRELTDVGRAARQQLTDGTAILSEVAEEVLVEAKILCPGQAVEYHIADPGQPLPLAGGTLRQLLAGLVRHSVKRAQGRPVRIEIGFHTTEAGLDLWVMDDNPTWPLAARQQLFEPFAGAAAVNGDPGLGLFLCSLLVDSLGGTLQVEAATNGGNRFIMALLRRSQVPGP